MPFDSLEDLPTNQLVYEGDAEVDAFTNKIRIVNVPEDALPPGGSAGPYGGAVTIPYVFSTTTTDSDPGAGNLRLDNATQNTATTIRADLVDSGGSTVTSILDTFDDSTSTVKGYIRLVKTDDLTKWLLFSVSALASPSGYKNITVAIVASSASSPFADGDDILLHFDRTGDLGGTGPTGATGVGATGSTGPTGMYGGPVTLPYNFDSTTTDSDPGSGNLRLSNATQDASTVIRADLVDSGGSTVTSIIDTFDDSTSTVKGHIRLIHRNDATKWILFTITSLASPSGYKNITVVPVSSSTSSPFTNGDPLLLQFERTGDKGATGPTGTGSGATGTANGYLSRLVYANASSAAIGGTYANETIQSVPTSWTVAADIPDGNHFIIDVYAAGGAGAGGGAQVNISANIQGGGGGGGGAHNQIVLTRAEMIAGLPITFTCPVGPTGGAGATSTGTYAGGATGADGGQASVEPFITAFGGGAGNRLNAAATFACGGGGGGINSAGSGGGTNTTAQAGGDPLGTANTANAGFGGAGSRNTAAGAGLSSIWGGGSGGNGQQNQGVGGRGGDSNFGGGGGAGGSCRNTATATPSNGGSGGVSGTPLNTTRASGGAGADGTLTQTASPGATGATGIFPFAGGGGGSGGDARSTTATTGIANGGAGGAGGFPGGGGGAGGPALKANTGTANSGAGGNGADACIVITALP